jgi:hypothetical protein
MSALDELGKISELEIRGVDRISSTGVMPTLSVTAGAAFVAIIVR